MNESTSTRPSFNSSPVILLSFSFNNPLLRAYDLRKIFKHIESLDKEINDAHIYLDELGSARTYDLKYLSLQERIDDILKKYKEKFFYY